MGAAQDKPISVNSTDSSNNGNSSNLFCCSECSSVCAVPASNDEAYNQWSKNMPGRDKTKKREPSHRLEPPSTPASQRLYTGTPAETVPASHGPQISAAGPAPLRSYSPSASYFIPAITPTQGWDAEGQAQLEKAVQQAARDMKVRTPGYRAMQLLKLEISRGQRPSIYNDG